MILQFGFKIFLGVWTYTNLILLIFISQTKLNRNISSGFQDDFSLTFPRNMHKDKKKQFFSSIICFSLTFCTFWRRFFKSIQSNIIQILREKTVVVDCISTRTILFISFQINFYFLIDQFKCAYSFVIIWTRVFLFFLLQNSYWF